ncbi:hypothetical protein [Nocardia sp. NPDC019395]|uniref:hypothetical protein n=1 Tax=Nocardia sp. NPDC019395 TaxID=3154686 RepID=UPI0033D7CE86
MAPEQASPYWDRIVGDDWPQIPPSAWHGLETAAREGAEALNLADIEQARRAFDEVVIQSEGLAQIRRALVALEQNPRAFAAALKAAADTFGTFGDVVRRTRNQILDVVENATDRIGQATSGDNNDDGEEGDEAEAEADRQAADAIVAEARGDVVDIVAAALSALGPQGLPRLDDIARELGQPGPWRQGARAPHAPPRKPGGQGRPVAHDRRRQRGRGFEAGPWVPGFERPVLPDKGLGQKLIDLIGDLLRPGPDPLGPNLPPGVAVDVPVGAGDMPAAPGVPAEAGPGPGPGDRGNGAPGLGAPGQPGPPDAGRAEPGPAGGVDGHGGGPEDRGSGGPGDRGGDNSGGPASDRADSVDRPGDASRAEHAGRPDGESQPDRELRDAGTHQGSDGLDTWNTLRGNGTREDQASEAGAAAPAPPPVFPAAPPPAPGPAAAPGPGSAGAGSPAAGAPAAAATSTQSMSSAAPAARGVVGPVDAFRAPGATGKVLTPGSGPGVSAVPGVKVPVPLPDGDIAPEKRAGGNELVQDAVGAAMVSASAPAFVVGERVDGDLVLARTLLGGIRAAADSWVVGVDWAVAVLRHQSGVSAFVTSNEGRGWLPARLYLPSEVSLPWLWAVAEDSGWEGIADPARILVEFAIAWGAKSGAKLSALASSQPVDPLLGRQLGSVSLAGSVPASGTMDLRAPSPGTLDRLGLTAAPRLLDRAAKVADDAIALRCLELAVDAHTRIHRAELPAVDAMGAPEIRLRILRAVRDGRDFADSWWEEIQDADDLIAATALGHRAETSRIGLGELRTDAADLDPGSELSVLRALTFQRRCNELVLLLSEEKSRQTLRDAVYAHAQILAHPLFAARRAESAPAPAPRATISAGPGR